MFANFPKLFPRNQNHLVWNPSKRLNTHATWPKTHQGSSSTVIKHLHVRKNSRKTLVESPRRFIFAKKKFKRNIFMNRFYDVPPTSLAQQQRARRHIWPHHFHSSLKTTFEDCHKSFLEAKIVKWRWKGNTKISNSNKLLFACVTTVLMISDAASRLRRRLCRRFEGKALIIIILLIAEKRFQASNFSFSMRCKSKLHHKRTLYMRLPRTEQSRLYYERLLLYDGTGLYANIKKLLLREH